MDFAKNAGHKKTHKEVNKMPRGDRTGPWGMGPRTGRRMGFCSGYPVPGYMNPGPGYGAGFGFGRGLGRGFGPGRGRWFRGYYNPYMMPYGMPYGYPYHPYYGQGYTGDPAGEPEDKE